VCPLLQTKLYVSCPASNQVLICSIHKLHRLHALAQASINLQSLLLPITRMTSGTLSSKTYPAYSSGHANLDIFRGHAFSFLVAVSVLFGSMFTAHSAIVELASIDAGNRLISLVEGVRGEIAQIPKRASAHMASVAAANTDVESLPASGGASSYFSFSSGLEGLFVPYINLVPIEQPLYAEERPLLANFEPRESHLPDKEHAIVMKVSDEHFESMSRVIWIAADPYIAVSEVLMRRILDIQHKAMGAYISGLYAWVDGTQYVASTAVQSAYMIGDSTIAVAAKGIPGLKLEEMPVVTLWIDTAHELARMIVVPQIAIGEGMLKASQGIRSESGQIQNALGGEIAGATLGVIQLTSDVLGDTPRAATASVADFLTLQEKR